MDMSDRTGDIGASKSTTPRGTTLTTLDAVNGFLVVAPLIAVTALHFTEIALTRRMALNHQSQALYQFYTSAFVHANTNHLVGNVVGYTIAVVPLYALYVREDRRQAFRRVFVVLLLSAPLVTSVMSYSIWTLLIDAPIQYGRGFSGVVSAFAGLLFIRVLAVVESELPADNASYVLLMVLVTLFGSWVILFAGVLRIVMGGLLVAVLTGGVIAARRGYLSPDGLDDWLRANLGDALVLTGALAAALFLIVVSFPADLQHAGGYTNLVGHGAGFFLGMAAAQFEARSAQGEMEAAR